MLQVMRKKVPTIRRKRALRAASNSLSLPPLSRPHPSRFWKSGRHEPHEPIGPMSFLNAPSEALDTSRTEGSDRSDGIELRRVPHPNVGLFATLEWVG